MTTPSPTAIAADPRGQPYAADVTSGEGQAASRLRLQISRIAPHFRTALVTGEAGSGKETVAREMHRLSGSAALGPFQLMDIADFADAHFSIELAGVLYLTGLDRLDPAAQERLVDRLRAFQRELRIIVASDCDLRSMLATGRMRQNLASRIGSLEIRVTSLRDRMEDFDLIVAAMLARVNARGQFTFDAVNTLKLHAWYGNLAELWSVVQHVAEVQGMIEPRDLPELLAPESSADSGARLDKVMQRHVFDVLQRCSGNKLRAAELLGISRSTLYRMLEAAAE